MKQKIAVADKIDPLANTINEEMPVEALNLIIEEVEDNWGEVLVTSSIRRRAAKKLGVDIEKANNWKTVSDILKEIDLVEISKKHNNEAGQLNKCAATIIGILFPVTLLFMNKISALSDRKSGKIVELVGRATPTHLLNTISKKLAERKFLTAKESCEDQLQNIDNLIEELTSEKTEKENTLMIETEIEANIEEEFNQASSNAFGKLFNKKKIAMLTEKREEQQKIESELRQRLEEIEQQLDEQSKEKNLLMEKLSYIENQNNTNLLTT